MIVREKTNNPAFVTSPKEIYQWVRRLEDSDREKMIAIYLNAANKVIGYHVVFVGATSSCTVSPREIIKMAIMVNATALAIAHNHPSGQAEPSRDDKRFTDDMKTACKLMGISFLDHLVVGDKGFYSIEHERGETYE